MPSKEPTLLGTTIRVPKGLAGKCSACEMHGRLDRLVTDGTETATVVKETFFNGKFTQETHRLAVQLRCPDDGRFVQFALDS